MTPVNNNANNGALCSFKKDRGMNWSEAETFSLLDVWSDNLIQSELGNSTRNQHVYQVISQALGARGIDRSATQCRVRIKNLKKEYKDVLDNKHDRRRSFRFFEKMHQIINGFQALAGAGMGVGELGNGMQMRSLSVSSGSILGDTNGTKFFNRNALRDDASAIMSPADGQDHEDRLQDRDGYSDDLDGELQDGDLSDEGSSMLPLHESDQQGMPEMLTDGRRSASSVQSTSVSNNNPSLNGEHVPLSFAATLSKTFGANIDLISLVQAQARAQSHAATANTIPVTKPGNSPSSARIKKELSPESSWMPVSSQSCLLNGETTKRASFLDNRSNGISTAFIDSQKSNKTINETSSEPKSKRMRLDSSSSLDASSREDGSLFTRFFAFQRDIERMRLEHEAAMEEKRRRWEDERRREERSHEFRLLHLMTSLLRKQDDNSPRNACVKDGATLSNSYAANPRPTAVTQLGLGEPTASIDITTVSRPRSLPADVNF